MDTSISRPEDPVDWLRSEFTVRFARNPNYSLRSFAKKIGVPHSRLSEILSRKRMITPALANKVCDGLDYDPDLANEFIAAVSRHRKRRENRLAGSDLYPNYRKLESDAFHAVSDWYHFAILSLMDTAGFDQKPAIIAKRLGISVVEVISALERLQRLDLISRGKDGVLTPTNKNITTTNDIPSAALRKSHKQSLLQALDSLETVAVEIRDITSITMAVDVSKLKQAKEKIRCFRREMASLLESGRQTEVYNLNIQLVPITKRRK